MSTITTKDGTQLVKGARLKVYPGLPHGMCQTHKVEINTDLLAFFREEARSEPKLPRPEAPTRREVQP